MANCVDFLLPDDMELIRHSCLVGCFLRALTQLLHILRHWDGNRQHRHLLIDFRLGLLTQLDLLVFGDTGNVARIRQLRFALRECDGTGDQRHKNGRKSDDKKQGIFIPNQMRADWAGFLKGSKQHRSRGKSQHSRKELRDEDALRIRRRKELNPCMLPLM